MAKVVADCNSNLEREITHCSEYGVTRCKNVTVGVVRYSRSTNPLLTVLLSVCAAKLNVEPKQLITNEHDRGLWHEAETFQAFPLKRLGPTGKKRQNYTFGFRPVTPRNGH